MNKLFEKKKVAIITSCLLLGVIVNNNTNAHSLNESVEQQKLDHVKANNEAVNETERHTEANNVLVDKEPISKKQSNDIHRDEIQNQADEHEEGIMLSPQKMSLANIKVTSLKPEYQFSTIFAPGEIKVNGYKSYVVSPRTESVIIKRHATLGEHVQQGKKLVTLFSETIAQAQADYLIAFTEWQRIEKLDNSTVSESQSLQTQALFNAAYGKLIALGLTEKAIQNISKEDLTTFGQYALIAQRAGVVLEDDFTQGQRVNAGDTIMLLADEEHLWVEAKVAPNKKLNLSVNAPAIVALGDKEFNANVIQEAHTIDPITRTRIVRLAVRNEDHNLHSGMFVKVLFQFKTQHKVLAVPEEALIRSADGHWTVFVEDHPGEFNAVEVELGQALGDYREILGLASGTRVVTQGAFFVASETAKGGFDPHNH